MAMVVTTRNGEVLSIEYRDLDGAGQRLAVRLLSGGGSRTLPLEVDRWYRLSVLAPPRPQVGRHMSMVLQADGEDPLVWTSADVMSVVGALA